MTRTDLAVRSRTRRLHGATPLRSLLPAALAALAACTSAGPAPELCALEQGQLRVYDAHGAETAGPLRTYGDRVGLHSANNSGSPLLLDGDEIVVSDSRGLYYYCPDGWAECGQLKAFARDASGNTAPQRVVRGGFTSSLRASWGELISPCQTCADASVVALSTSLLRQEQLTYPPTTWELHIPGAHMISAAIDERRQQVLVSIAWGTDANYIPSRSALRAYPRGTTDPAAFAWEIDLAGDTLSLGPIDIDAAADELVAVAWRASVVRGDWSGAELRSWRLSDAAPQPSRTELLYASSEEVGWSGDALRVIAGGRFLLRASQGRLIGRDWTLDVRAGEADVHVAGFAVDDARQELVVLRDHLLDRQFAFNGVPGRRSIAVFKLQPDGSLPELLRIIDGGPSLAADPRGLASDPARGEVTLSAGSPGALTTFSVDSPDGAPAVGSLPMADLGLASTWLTARGARGQLWAFQHPSRPLGEPAAADGSLASLLVFDAGAPRGPAASFSLEGTGTVMALLADHKRDELWLVSGDQPDVTGVPQAWSARVLALEGGRLVERGVRSLPAEAAALDPVRDEVWTLSDLGASAWPAALAAGVRPRLTIAAQGAPSAAPVVDGRSGELYLPVALGTEADRSWAVEVHDTGTGALLRTLRGVHADALAICR